ncbi:MAG: carbohydrate-binding module 48 [Spirochaetales bacterium]|nr:glycogen-binding domain-containing protein [Leptospiraceae bacterium]MCP5480860.1 carbohydrate-binding module 48 [Spirochaetales bacterium]
MLSRPRLPLFPVAPRARLLAITLVLGSISALGARENDWVGGYNSTEAGLEESLNTGREERVYTEQQLEQLRRAVSPRYVRVLRFGHERGGVQDLVKGLLFSYEGYRARSVAIAGDFNNWVPGLMRRNQMGVYYYILPVREIEGGEMIDVYRYKFLVDGIWQADPTNRTREDDGLGGYISVFHLLEHDVDRLATVRIIRERQVSPERLVEFAIYLPDVENLALVGDFNNWNPEHDLMQKGPDGIFRLRRRLRPGEYIYKFVADGKWILDRFNHETRFNQEIHELCSHLLVE